MDARTRLLLEAPIGPTILRLALPNLVIMLVQASIGLVETYFVGKLGTDALAGMALVFPILMSTQMVSAGAMGGGILTAVARTLGAGRGQDAYLLAWHAAAIAFALGLFSTLAAFAFGRPLYALMGGHDGSLVAALTYSNFIFAGAIPLWLFNSLAAVIRGTGNMVVPASVTTVGAIVLIPLSAALIFGWGPIPALGIIGGAAAVVSFYVVASGIFAAYIWSGRGVLHPPLRPPRLRWAPTREILRVGAMSSIVSLSTNIAIATATGFVGMHGAAAVAGYGTGSRLEYMLVPLIFGLGAPLGALVGTAIGADRRDRALRIAWTGAAIAGIVAETIGLAAAAAPQAWLTLFGQDSEMIASGSQYLRIVGPFYGFFGIGLALYFASQGAGRMTWPFFAAILRVIVAVGGGWLALRLGAGLAGVFAALGAGLATMGLINVASIALGAWFGRSAARELPAAAPVPQSD